MSAALAAFAAHQFRLAMPQADGRTLRDHLEAFETITGRRHPLRDGPQLPPTGAALWAWFVELRAAQEAERPLGFADIAAWAELTGERPRPWEVRMLRALDAMWLRLSR